MNTTFTSVHGIPVILNHIDGVNSVNILILAGAGSRYETANINGISHYLEHLFFKGGKKYKTAKDVSATIDGLGGEMNAFTGKEYAGYYIKIANHHVDTAIDILSDMLCCPQFPKEEIEKERGVILEEYNMYQDTPMYQVVWNFERLVFGDQPLGWDEIGTKELIKSVQQEDFFAYKDKLYTKDNIVISITGKIDEQKIIKSLEECFILSDKKKEYDFLPYIKPINEKRIHVQHKKTEQAHVVVGVECFDYKDQRRYAIQVLSTILGGNMSSRLFQKIREERGLAYYVQTTIYDYYDTGVLYTRCGVTLKDIQSVISYIEEEYEIIKNEEVTDEELHRAKEYLKGKMILSFEDSEEISHFYAWQKLMLGEIQTPEEIMKKIDAVTKQDIKNIAQEIFSQKPYISVIGPFEEEDFMSKI